MCGLLDHPQRFNVQRWDMGDIGGVWRSVMGVNSPLKQTLEVWHLIVGLTIIAGGGLFSLGTVWQRFSVAEQRISAIELRAQSNADSFTEWKDRDLRQWQDDVNTKLARILTILERESPRQ